MDCGIITSKTVLLCLSLIFWVAGAFMAYVASVIIKTYEDFNSFIHDQNIIIPAAVIIGISVVMFIFGIVGCCSTLRESKFGLSCFFFIIMLIFAAEVAALVLTFINRDKINQKLERAFPEVFANYNGQNEDSATVNSLQSVLQCCGVKNYTSWTNTTWFAKNNSVPLSCCKQNATAQCTGRLDQPDLLYPEGCEVKVEHLIQESLTYAMLAVLGCAIIKFFGMLSVCVITCHSKNRRNGYESFYA